MKKQNNKHRQIQVDAHGRTEWGTFDNDFFGKVMPRDVCCRAGWVADKGRNHLYCRRCGKVARAYYLYLYHKPDDGGRGRDVRIYRNPVTGEPFRTIKEAQDASISLTIEMATTQTFDIKNWTGEKDDNARSLFEKFLQVKTIEKVAPSYLREIKRYVSTYYVPFFSSFDIRDTTNGRVEDFYLQLPEHLSPKTKKNILITLKSFFSWLHRRGEVKQVPVFPKVSVPEPVIQVIDRATQFRIVDAVPERHRAIIEFLMRHPVRVAEARALCVEDVDTEHRILHINKSFSLKVLGPRKNKKPYYIPLSKDFNMEPHLKDKTGRAFVFVNEIGRPYTAEGLRRIWHRALKKAKVPPISLYNASRHSIATQAVNSGIDLARVSKALGHSSLAMTERYAKMSVELLRDMIDRPEVVDIQKARDKSRKLKRRK